MTQAKLLTGLRKLPWKTKAVCAVLGSCALVIFVTTFFIVVQILRIQWFSVGEAVAPAAVPAPSKHQVEHPLAAPFSQVYEIQGIRISLGNRNRTLAAYAEFTLVLDCPSKESRRWMEISRASLRDAIYEATIAFTVEDFDTPDGFKKIKKAILDAFKARFGVFAPREVNLKDWLIQ